LALWGNPLPDRRHGLARNQNVGYDVEPLARYSLNPAEGRFPIFRRRNNCVPLCVAVPCVERNTSAVAAPSLRTQKSFLAIQGFVPEIKEDNSVKEDNLAPSAIRLVSCFAHVTCVAPGAKGATFDGESGNVEWNRESLHWLYERDGCRVLHSSNAPWLTKNVLAKDRGVFRQETMPGYYSFQKAGLL
jgi:hypothetical protein